MHQISNFKRFLSRLAFVFAQSIEARYYVNNEDVVPTTTEWSTSLLPTRVRPILEVLRQLKLHGFLSPETELFFVKTH